jgi:hypothetical protein
MLFGEYANVNVAGKGVACEGFDWRAVDFFDSGEL